MASTSEQQCRDARYVTALGLQYVRPYESRSVYRVKKERHAQMSDAQILSDMFPQSPTADSSLTFWQGELDAGRTTGVAASSGDLRQLVVTRHVHEQAILAAECSVIYEDEQLMAINKPPGMPTLNEIQGVGYNTALGVMQHRMGGSCKLAPMHRLDKPVSGVLLMVKTHPGKQVRNPLVRKLQKHITKHKVTKHYIARVCGLFPSEPLTCTAPLLWCDGANRGTASVSLDRGKPCETRFSLLSHEGDSSLVRCQPITGRPHQIRAHLQHLGYPIGNDETYGGAAELSSVPLANTDDEHGTLQALFLSESRDWCHACTECMRQLRTRSVHTEATAVCTTTACDRNEAALGGDVNRMGGKVRGGIWLHSLRYEFTELPEMPVLQAPLPGWALQGFKAQDDGQATAKVKRQKMA